MSLVNKISDIYNEAINTKEIRSINPRRAEAIAQVKQVTRYLIKNAKKGVDEVRLDYNTVHPDVVSTFVAEGFIVWANSEVVVIKIPPQT